MKNIQLALHALATCVVLAGCASTLSVTYRSDPSGATVYQEGGTQIGRTPVLATYTPTKEMQRGGCMKTKGVTVRWASGAQASIPLLKTCASHPARNFVSEFTFQRPDVPGRAFDVNVALAIERNEILAEQARAQEDQATIQALMTISQQNAARQSITCQSQQVGNTVQTTCP